MFQLWGLKNALGGDKTEEMQVDFYQAAAWSKSDLQIEAQFHNY